jgi:hypothetical protein
MSAYDGVPNLPSTKVDSASPSPAPANETWHAAEFNALVTAVADLRAAFIGGTPSEGGAGNSLTLAQNGSPPATAASKAHLYTDGLRLLTLLNGGGHPIQVQPNRINVCDFGADPTGAIDSTTAIQTAASFSNANIATQTGHGSLTPVGDLSQSSRQTLYFPAGLYKVSNTLTLGAYDIVGDDAIILGTDATKDILNLNVQGNSRYTVQGLTFLGGKNQIFKDMGATNNCVCRIRDCRFINSADAGCGVQFGPTDRGTNTISDCFFYQGGGAGVCVKSYGGDRNMVYDCYVISGNGPAFDLKFSCWFKNISCAPGGTMQSTWIHLDGGSVIAEQFRFGLELPMTPIVATINSSGCWIILRDCDVNTTDYIMKLSCAPTVIDVDCPSGQGGGIWFDPAMSNAEKAKLASIPIRIKGLDRKGVGNMANNSLGLGPTPLLVLSTASTSDLYAAQSAMIESQLGDSAKPCLLTDYVLGIDVSACISLGHSAGASANMSGATTTNIFGGPVLVFTEVSGLDGNVFEQYTHALDNLPAGTYTIAAEFNVTAPSTLQLLAADVVRDYQLRGGDPMPRVHAIVGSPTQARTVGISLANIAASGVCTFGRLRVLKGVQAMPDDRMVCYGSAPPVKGMWQPGDEVINPQPAAGASPGWVCTTAGFSYSASWAQNTDYAQGVHVLANGAVYYARQGGHSASMGGGPNSNTGGTVDNTVIWDYLGSAVAVFKARANLAA